MTATETPADVWARIAQPLPYPTPPVIVTPTMHAAFDHERDKQHAARKDDWRFIHRWSLDAREHTEQLAAEGVSSAGYEPVAPE